MKSSIVDDLPDIAAMEAYASASRPRDLLKNAFEVNQYVPAMLAGEMPPRPSQEGLVFVGSPEEASAYVMEFGVAWTNTAGAVEWLATAQRDDAHHPPGS